MRRDKGTAFFNCFADVNGCFSDGRPNFIYEKTECGYNPRGVIPVNERFTMKRPVYVDFRLDDIGADGKSRKRFLWGYEDDWRDTSSFGKIKNIKQ